MNAELAELHPAVVEATTTVARDVRLLTLALTDRPAVAYPPGSHLELELHTGERWERRSYSLVGDTPVGGHYRIAVKSLVASRGGSVGVHRLAVGDPVRISAPRDHFPVTYGRPEYLLVAGGIGITPLLGMAQALARRGESVRLVHAVRSRGDLMLADELRATLGQGYGRRVSDEAGRLDLAEEISGLHAEGELYVCGPLPMLDAARRAWAAASRPVERLRFETFGSGGRQAPKPFVARVCDYGDREVPVDASTTLLDALEAAGIAMIADCRRGECGLCQVQVVGHDGTLDHRDVFLSEDERRAGSCLVSCVSRAAGGAVAIDTGRRP